MQQYHMINRDGKDCGIKTLTDNMADRLEASGWTLVPVSSSISAQAK